MKIIEYFSKEYPERLREIDNPPTRLYVLGNEKILNETGIAVIGSRNNTQYGEEMCKKFTKSLVEYNINIISGMALGIDSIAHKTCIKNSGRTIAVLPSGLENIYPKENLSLLKEILNNGGTIISEYDKNVKADSKKFLERNRIVAGLAIGTLVVEAGYRSGTSVTARYAKKQGKPVFCIPSSLENIKGKTTNKLIQKGSYLVTEVDDIIKCYPNIKFSKRKLETKDIYIDIPQDLLQVYKIIKDIPQDINEISRKVGLPISEVSYKTMLLQLENRILELPGQRFVRKDESEY